MAWMITRDRTRRIAGVSQLDGLGQFTPEDLASECKFKFKVMDSKGNVAYEGVATEPYKEIETIAMCHIGRAFVQYVGVENNDQRAAA
jgi:hypothetical protein